MKRIVILLFVLAMILAGCGGTEAPPTAVPEPTDVEPAVEATQEPVPEPATTEAQPEPTQASQEQAQDRTAVRFAVADWDLPQYEPFIAAFEEENPDLKVQVVSLNEVLELGSLVDIEIPEDADQRLVAAADVVQIDVQRPTVRDGLVRDLTPLMEADATFQAEDFHPGVLERYQWEGGTWALPVSLYTRLIYFNKDAFDEAGVAYPEAGWSWDDLLAKAQALTVRDGDQVAMWGFVVPTDLAYRFIESRVGTLVDETRDPLLPKYDDPDTIEAVGWYTDLYLEEQVMPYAEPQEEGDQLALTDEQALIDSGLAAMWTDLDLLFWYRNQQSNVGVAPFPADSSDWPATPVWPQIMAMSAGTTQPEAAWRWMEFLSRQSLAGLGPGMKILPARRSMVETGDFWADMDEGLATALRYALDHSYVAREPVGWNAFDEAMHSIWQGEKPVEDALAEAQSQVEANVQEAAASAVGATPVPTFVVEQGGEEEQASEGAVTITYVPGIGSFNLEPYRALAKQFQEANPDIVVDVKMLDVTSGTVPDFPNLAQTADCFMWYPSFQDAKNRDAILNLEPFLDADPAFTTDDYYPQVLDQFTWQGQVWGLPADVTPFIVEYNKDLFDAAGLAYPAVGWTWDDFLEMSVALTDGEGDAKQYGYVAEVYESTDLLLSLERLGAKLIDENADPPAYTYDDPSVVEAMRWYADLTTEHGVKPAFLTDITKLLGASTAYLEREALINEGKAAMWTNPGTTAALFGGREGLEVGAVPLPVRADGASGGSLLTSSGNFISSSTENRQACWQWITFLARQPSAVQGFPASRLVAESNEYREQVGADRADAYMASVDDAETPSAFQIFSEEDWMGGAIFWLTQAYGKVVDGESSVEAALAAAQQMADDYRACIIAADDMSQETADACVREIDPSLPDFLFTTGE